MSCVAQRRAADPSFRPRVRPLLNAAEYLALLNQQLQAHPMYLEGMAFPVALADDADAVEDETMPLVRLVHDTRWDHFGVFASVIDEVGQRYELAPTTSTAMASASPVACRQRLAPLGGKTSRLRQATR